MPPCPISQTKWRKSSAKRASHPTQGCSLNNAFRSTIKRRDIDTLTRQNCINDNVINFYLQMISERSKKNANWPTVYAFNTLFYPYLMFGGHSKVKGWTKIVDLFSYDLILIPVLQENHWCLATVDFSKPAVSYYDSRRGNNTPCLDAICEYLEYLAFKKKLPYSTEMFAKVYRGQRKLLVTSDSS
jgi:sentrin-specific protease 1